MLLVRSKDRDMGSLKLCESESKSDIASRWVHRKSNFCSHSAVTKIKETRMYSSRMRTVRSSSRLLGRGGGCLPQCMLGYTPLLGLGLKTPPGYGPRHPPGPGPGPPRHGPGHPPGQTPNLPPGPGPRQPPPPVDRQTRVKT